MKKLSLLVCLMTVTAGLAVAQSTVSVPFFADNDANSRQAFVGLQNIGAGTIVVSYEYRDKDGANPETGTFSLDANQSISYRPATDVGAGEVQPAALNDASYPNGSIKFETTGSLAGRYVSLEANGAFAHNLQVN